jgi:hypothetical protein
MAELRASLTFCMGKSEFHACIHATYIYFLVLSQFIWLVLENKLIILYFLVEIPKNLDLKMASRK